MSIAAVILSDLHLGAPHSVLNLRQWEPSELDGVVHGEAAREALCDALAAATAGERVERLILLGDVVDLSHGTFAHGVEELNSLLAQVRGVVEVSELVYVPGNHDRHWWTLQCEYDWLIRPLLEGEPGEARLDHPRTTPPEGRQDATLFRDALPDHADLMITVAYPDYAFDAGDARVHCHHGHLLRDVYALGAELLETVLEDMSDPERRNVDRQRHRTGWSRRTESEQPGDDAARAARVAAARELFADAIRITLGDGADGRTGRVGLEALEQLSAPLIDLDWLALGQTGLLRRDGEREALGRRILTILAGAPRAQRDALIGLGELFALAVLDRFAGRSDGKPHGYGHSLLRAGVVPALVDALLGDRPDAPIPAADAPSPALNRGATISHLKPAIRRYLARTGGAPPTVLVLGHTHARGTDALTVDGQTITIVNTGSWVASRRLEVPEGRVCVIRESGDVAWVDARLQLRPYHAYDAASQPTVVPAVGS